MKGHTPCHHHEILPDSVLTIDKFSLCTRKTHYMNVRVPNSNGTSNEKRLVVAECEGTERVAPLVEDYAAGRVSGQVLRIVMNYVKFINRTVWPK